MAAWLVLLRSTIGAAATPSPRSLSSRTKVTAQWTAPLYLDDLEGGDDEENLGNADTEAEREERHRGRLARSGVPEPGLQQGVGDLLALHRW
jgi:hypothetical protein